MSYRRYESYKDSGFEWLGKVPAHWQIERLGKHFKERKEKVSDADFPPLSVTMNGIVPQLETAAKSDAGDNRRKVVAGDFVINSRSDRKGSSGVSELEGSVSLISIVLKPRDLDRRYVHQLLRSYPFQEEFYRYGKGIVADLWSTNYSEMKNIVIPIPTKSEQVQIAAFLDKETAIIDTLIENQQQLVKLLQEKRQAVISHAVIKGLNPEAKMRDSGVEWLGEVPEHWDVKTIGKSTLKITNGYVGPTRDILVKSGVNYIQATHIKSGKIIFRPEYFVTKDWSEKHQKSILQFDDVLIVQTGAGTGDIALVTEKEVGFNCHALIILQSKPRILSGKYLSMVLQSRYGQSVLYSIRTGGMHPHLNCGEVKYVRIPIPPRKEQLGICAHVEHSNIKFDSMVNAANRMIRLLSERRSAVISAAVTGKIDVRDAA